jgi:hypothetical protein
VSVKVSTICRIVPEVDDAGLGCRATPLAARFHRLEAITERILDKEATLAVNPIVRTRSVAGVSTPASEHIEILYLEGDVGLLGGAKLRIDSEMQLSIAELKPGSAPPGKGGRLGYLAQTENLAIEPARLVLETTGHRHLYVIDAQNDHVLVQ